ncbi:hypothetical protein BC962_1760 [Gillisia mitskevichiae]|uniref:Uncharacterized protein n=1 Tax=Gillisia mitskevichiae TaxID=270921 RepID=A0A495PVK2_9FLAO|nr:hypothetical protein BC962_1760 [Gillisia mitskevichiae]
MNKLIIIGIIVLLSGIAAHYLIETTEHGFWIGALMGAGGVLIITGISKQFG